MIEFSAGLQGFYNSTFLSDCKVKVEDTVYNAHKIVLASYSRYLFSFFQKNSNSEILLPDFVQPKISAISAKEVFPEVLRYIYSGQNPDSIVETMNASAAFMFLSLATALEIQPLVETSEKYITMDILTPDTALDILTESFLLKNSHLTKNSVNEIIKHFEHLAKDQIHEQKLLNLPYETILEILSSSDLAAPTEATVFSFICKYISQLPAEDPRRHDLLSKVRWAFLSHTELMQAAANPLLASFKDLILEGLSAQLSQLEQNEYKYSIDTEPRVSYAMSTSYASPKAFPRETFARSQPLMQKSSKSLKQIFSQPTVESVELEFSYCYDFDENGVLYYLGSSAKARRWQNPHILGEVRAFGSNVGYGKIEDFVGRNCNSLRTVNEEGSFLGVDLGPGRLLDPSAYTIRNSSNVSYATMNWQFEGSLDRIRWVVLDKRIHYVRNSEYDSQMEIERSVLMKRGASSTWAVASINENAFRYFRIAGTQKNLSGTMCLAISCIEIYGRAISGRWP